MKRTCLAAIMMFLVLSPIGCGHSSSSSPPPTSFIMSDPAFDGDIALSSTVNGSTFTITQGMSLISPSVQSVFAGIDPQTGTEYRAFLDFPLGGPGGVPVNAIIDSATIDIVIKNIFLQSSTSTVPIRIDLVDNRSLQLTSSNYDQPLSATTTLSPPISQIDFVGEHISIDVTSLMAEAQLLGLTDFQIRIMEDLGLVSHGLIEINDTTASSVDRGNNAPQLVVIYH